MPTLPSEPKGLLDGMFDATLFLSAQSMTLSSCPRGLQSNIPAYQHAKKKRNLRRKGYASQQGCMH
eukprot:1157333-Pelagomonas_calceolata.AAC.5